MGEQGYDSAMYKTLFESAALAMVIHGADGRVIDANDAFAGLLGYTHSEALALSAAEVIHPSVRAQRDADAHRLLAGQARNLAAERQLVRRDGSTIWARVKKTAIEHRGETVVMVTIEDWSEHRITLQELTFAAHHDALTGLPNRTGLRRYLHDLGPERDALLLLMIDVDRLKAFNDAYGHAVGDELLRLVAQRLSTAVSTTGIASRLAGDEFVIVDAVEDGGIEDQVHRSIGRPAVLAGVGTLLPSVSVGSAVMAPRMHLASALRQADESMYRDKRSARRSRDRRR